MDFVLIIIWVWNLMLERTNDSFWWEWWLNSRWFLLSNAMIWKACNLENKLWLNRDCWFKFIIFVANILLLDNGLKTKPLSLYWLLLDSKMKLCFVWTIGLWHEVPFNFWIDFKLAAPNNYVYSSLDDSFQKHLYSIRRIFVYFLPH